MKDEVRPQNRHIVYEPGLDFNLVKGPTLQLLDIIRYRHVIRSLLVHRLTQRYHGSSLGIAWTLLNPLITMISLAIIIPMIARFQVPNYVVFLFSGITVWWAINGSIISGGDSIIYSEDLIKKVYLPRIIFPFVHVTIELINLFIAFLSLFVLGIMFGLHIKPNFIFLFVSICISYLFCLGLGFIMSILVVYFRDLKHITGVVLQAIFYISAIIFPADMIPSEYRILLTVNPFYHFIKLFQIAIYNPVNADWSSFTIPTVIGLTCLWIGLIIQWVFGKKIVYHL